MAPSAPVLCLLVFVLVVDCLALPAKVSEHRQSKASPIFVKEDPSEHAPSKIEPIHRSGGAFDAPVDAQNDSPKQNVFFGQPPIAKDGPPMGAPFENVPNSYIGPNYLMSNGPNRALTEDQSMVGANFAEAPSRQGSAQPSPLNPYYRGLFGQMPLHKVPSQKPTPEDSINDVFNNAFKKYNVKKYLMQKIFGTSHEADDDESGFFSNKHLKRHGTAGVAAKVLGELIGIKIRESIEGLGKSFSEYAKDFTARNFVNLGQVFSRVLKLQ